MLLISLFKKGSRDLCDNYQGIALLSIIGKVFARVLLNCLEIHIIPSILSEPQCGFFLMCGTVYMIFSAHQIQEKCIEQGLDLYQCFIDIVKAFDTINHEMIWKVLGRVGCPPILWPLFDLFIMI